MNKYLRCGTMKMSNANVQPARRKKNVFKNKTNPTTLPNFFALSPTNLHFTELSMLPDFPEKKWKNLPIIHYNLDDPHYRVFPDKKLLQQTGPQRWKDRAKVGAEFHRDDEGVCSYGEQWIRPSTEWCAAYTDARPSPNRRVHRTE